MRRSIVLLSLFLAATTISVLTVAGPAGAARLSPRIVCPQIEPCCPIPVTGPTDAAHTGIPCCATTTGSCCTTTCCSSVTCCSSGTCCTPTPCTSGALTIASSSNPSIAGRKVVISGVLTASPASGAQVVLWRERAGQSSFHQLAHTTTNSSGGYTFTLKRGTVMADQAWYVTSGSLHSATLEQTVRAIVALAPSTHTIVAGQPVVLRGHVTPSHSGDVVLIEQRGAAGWHVIARPRLSKGSTYSLSHRFMHAGKSELRAVLQLDARNVTSVSPTVTLTVQS
jgi:hypothetical protein